MIFSLRGNRRTAICIHILLLCKFIERLKEVSNYTVLVALYVFCNYQLGVVNYSFFDVSHFVFCECNCIALFR